jgi:hypothetical protein
MLDVTPKMLTTRKKRQIYTKKGNGQTGTAMEIRKFSFARLLGRTFGSDSLPAAKALGCVIFAALFSARIYWDRTQPIIALLKNSESDDLFRSLLPIRVVLIVVWTIMGCIELLISVVKNHKYIYFANIAGDVVILTLLLVCFDARFCEKLSHIDGWVFTGIIACFDSVKSCPYDKKSGFIGLGQTWRNQI